MKSFTDIEQSKKLSEILPVESADMWWSKNFIYYNPTASIGIGTEYNDVYTYKFGEDDIPCWSLAALLNLLPSVITRNGKRMFLTLEKAGAYNLYYKSPDRLDELWETKEDAIDACYEMILKLHEEKLL